MKQIEKEEKKRERRKALDMLCSRSALLLSVVSCLALIHVELRIQEHHRLISYSITSCDQMETKILKKLQPQSHGHWQANKESHSGGHWQEIQGQVLRGVRRVVIHVLTTAIVSVSTFKAFFVLKDIPLENGFLQT